MPKQAALRKFPEFKIIIEEFFTTIHEMTCDSFNSSKSISSSRIYLNLFIIGWFFVQLSSYFVEATRKQISSKLFNMVHVLQTYSRITPIFNEDSVTNILIANVIILMINLFFFSSASVLTFYSIVYERKRIKRAHWLIILVSKVSWWFAEIFNWTLFIPFLESAVLLLVKLWEKESFSIAYLFVGGINCLASFLVAIVVNFFSNNYNFNPKGTLKQRFQNYKNMQTIATSIIVFLLFTNFKSNVEIIHALIHITGILLLADFSRLSFPYQEKKLSLFYFSSILVAESYAVIMTLREFTKINDDEALFYTWMCVASFMILISRVFINSGWNKSLNINYNNAKLESVCIFYEEIMDLAESSFEDPVKYMRLLGWVRFHRSQCYIVDCYCRQPYWNEVIQGRGTIKLEAFVDWVEKMLLQKVQNITRNTTQSEAESFLLKYFSFLMKYSKNFIKAHFEINFEGFKLGNKLSFHYKTICRGYQNIIQDKLGIHKSSASSKDIETYRQNINFDRFVNSESVKVECRKLLADLLEKKMLYWKRLIDGYESINDFYRLTREIIQGINKLQNIIQNELKKSPEDLIFLKLHSMVTARLISNPALTSKIERKLNDMKKKDSIKDLNIIHTISIMKGNVISLVASFLDDYGKIITFSDGAPRFFGYSRTEFSTFRNINNVMPPIFSVVHDTLVNRLIITGQEKIIKKYRPAVSMYKNGTIFLCKLFVTYFFPLIDDFAFSALFLKISSDSIFFLLSPSMRIQGICDKAMKTFEVPEQLIQGFSFLNLGILIADIYAIIENFNKYGTGENIKTKMVIPVNIKGIIEFFMNYTKLNQEWECTPMDQISHKVENFVANHSEFFSSSRIFQVSMNVIRDNVKMISGEFLVIYIVEIHDCYELDDMNLSEHSIHNLTFTKIDSTNVNQNIENPQRNPLRTSRASFIFNNASDILKVRKVAIQMQECRNKKKKKTIMKNTSPPESSPKQSPPRVNHNFFPTPILEESPTLRRGNLETNRGVKEEAEEFDVNSSSKNSPCSLKVNNINGNLNLYDFNTAKQDIDSMFPMMLSPKAQNLKTSGHENNSGKDTEFLSPSRINALNGFPNLMTFGQAARRATYTSQLNPEAENNDKRLGLQRYSTMENSVENPQLKNCNNDFQEISLNLSAASKPPGNPSTNNWDTSESNSLTIQNNNNGQMESIRFSEEKKKAKPIYKKQEIINHPASVGSSTSSLVNSLASIHNLVTEKRVPMIVKSLYISIFFKLIAFLTLLIIYNLYTNQIFEQYKNLIGHVSFGVKLTSPYIESINLINNAIVDNILEEIHMASHNETDLEAVEAFENKVKNKSLENFRYHLTNHLSLVTFFNFQTNFLQWEAEFEFLYLSNKLTMKFNFVQFLKKLLGSMFEINQIKSEDITYNDPDVFTLIKNFPTVLQKFPLYLELIENEINQMSESLYSFNIICLSTAICILFLATFLMLPAYKKYTAYIERILKMSARVNEKEAQGEIDQLKDTLDMLNSYDEFYVNVDFSSNNEEQIADWKHKTFNIKKQVITKNFQDSNNNTIPPKSSSGTNHISERIKSTTISSVNFVMFILILFILASAFYVGVYAYVQNFPGFVSGPLNIFKSYFRAVTKFNSIPAENDLVLLGLFIKKLNSANITLKKNYFFYDDNFLNLLQQIKTADLPLVSHHFETEMHSILFKDIQIDAIRRYNSEELCDMVSDYGCAPAYCKSLMKGVLSRGLQMGITVMLTDLKNDDDLIETGELEEIKNLLTNQEYHERALVLMIINHTLYKIIEHLEDYIRGIIEDYMSNMKLIFLFGSLIFMVFFLMIVITYFNKLQQNYYKVNQGLQLLPSKRLLSDDTLKSLIKKFIQ